MVYSEGAWNFADWSSEPSLDVWPGHICPNPTSFRVTFKLAVTINAVILSFIRREHLLSTTYVTSDSGKTIAHQVSENQPWN